MPDREEVLERPAFNVGDREFRWADVVAAGRAWSRWSALERRAAGAVAAREADLDEREVEAAQNAFRYGRNLLAADDLEAWLDGWGVGLDDWLDQIRGSVLAEEDDAAVDDPDAVWAEAVCSGELERLAADLAERLAVFEAVTGEVLDEPRLDRMEDVFERFRDEAASPESLERELRDEKLEWTRIEGRLFAHRDENVVREAALCFADGDDLGELAARAGARLDESAAFYIGDSQDELRPHLLAADPGKLCGPLATAGEYWLLDVTARVPPSLEDAEISSRARERLIAAAVRREVLKRVRWHAPIL